MKREANLHTKTGEKNDLTEGNIIRTVIVFAIPFLLANLIQALYGAADLWVVGRYCGRNALGVAASSAVGIASKYDVFAMLPATSVASALASIVAQNYGAKKYDRMNRALLVGILAAAPFSLAFFLWAQLSPETMIGAFSADISVIEAGIPFFRTCSFDYLCVLLVFSMNGYLNGCGKTIFTMLSCCFGALALRMPLIYLVCRFAPQNLGVIGTVAPAVSGIMAAYTAVYVWKLMVTPEIQTDMR